MDPLDAADSTKISSQFAKKSNTVSDQNSTDATSTEKSVNFVATEDLSAKVASSDADIREDIVERAKKLVNDPNWLNDSNISALTDKLISVENF